MTDDDRIVVEWCREMLHKASRDSSLYREDIVMDGATVVGKAFQDKRLVVKDHPKQQGDNVVFTMADVVRMNWYYHVNPNFTLLHKKPRS